MRRRLARPGLIAGPLLAALLPAAVLLAGCGAPASAPGETTQTAAGDASRAPSASSASGTPGGSVGPTADLRPTDVATDLAVPWGVVPLPDGSTLVSERDSGQILRLDGAKRTTLATLADVRAGGEGGLLGLTLSPDRSRLFAYFTAADDNRIVAMSWDGSRLGRPETVFTGIPKGAIHNGGRMVIGPDGYLYVGTGESGDRDLAQDRDSLGGKILRLTLDGHPAPDNPFGTAVWSYGHRNVQGLAFDSRGRLWASEFGQNTWDELNLIVRGANYGWPVVEGSGNREGMTDPAVVWRTGDASPSGLAFWRDSLWMASLRGARLWEIPLGETDSVGESPGSTAYGTGQPVAHLTGDYGRLRTVVPTADGSVLLVSTNNTDGRGSPSPGDDRLLRVTR